MIAGFSGQIQISYLNIYIAGEIFGRKNRLRFPSSWILNFGIEDDVNFIVGFCIKNYFYDRIVSASGTNVFRIPQLVRFPIQLMCHSLTGDP